MTDESDVKFFAVFLSGLAFIIALFLSANVIATKIDGDVAKECIRAGKQWADDKCTVDN